MGAVFSVIESPFRLVECVLRTGTAVTAAISFYPFNPNYFTALLAILPYCESAEAEPFQDFSAALDDLCNEQGEDKLEGLDLLPLLPVRLRPPPTTSQPNIWKSRTAEAKKLYKTVLVEAQRKAVRFQRRYRLYGPPDWTDPASLILSPSCLIPPTFTPNVIPSLFPHAVPHIVISPPPYDHTVPIINVANGVPSQDHAYGDRLIVSEAPSLSGPQPVIMNAAPEKPVHGLPISDEQEPEDDSWDVPSLVDGSDDGTCSGSSECGTVDDSTGPASLSMSIQEVLFRRFVSPEKIPAFWIEEDGEGLPDLPDNW